MSITYAAVIRGNVIIASYSDPAINLDKDVLKLMSLNSSKIDQKISGQNVYSYLTGPVLTFACVSSISVDKKIPLTFLDTLSRRWSSALGADSNSASSHQLDDAFRQNFSNLFTNSTDTVSVINQQFEETQRILGESVSKAYDRGAKLEDLGSRSEDLLLTSEEFRTQATNLKWRMKCAMIKSWLIWIAVIIVILYFILSLICGGFNLKPRCR